MTDEKSKEKSKEELRAEMAMKNLKGSLWNYAAPKIVTHSRYGEISDSIKYFYSNLIAKAPDQNIYNQLFLPQLMYEGGAITSPYLQNTSYAILQDDLLNIKIEDALGLMGYKGTLKKELSGKYVKDTGGSIAGLILDRVFRTKGDMFAKDILDTRIKEGPKDLEAIIGEPENKEQGKQ